MALAEWLVWDSSEQAPGVLSALVNPLRSVPEISAPSAYVPAGLSAADYARALVNVPSGFAQYPTWCGQAAETGPLARWQHAPPVAAWLADGGSQIGARIVARAVDLAYCALHATGAQDRWSDAEAWGPGPGLGCARVDTARGLLLHRVWLSGNRIVDYLIVAPTEWNFHPEGMFRSALMGLPLADVDAVERRARYMVLALDPCVDYGLRVLSTPSKTPWNSFPTTGLP